jgi:Fe-Mn family superoxide dismutase
MSRDLERRDFIRSAGLIAGATAAATLVERSAFAQSSPTGVRPVNYQAKPLSLDPKSITGISEKVLVSHYENNYVGAVKRLNAIGAQLAELDFAKAPNFVVNGLKREELIAANSMILHEIYFDSLGGASRPAGTLADAITRDFGSLERWRTGDGQGRGRRLRLGDPRLFAARQAAGQPMGRRPHHDAGRRAAGHGARHV